VTIILTPGNKSIECPQRSQFDVDAPMPVVCNYCKIRGQEEQFFQETPEIKVEGSQKGETGCSE
jgi:hypothetical protein